MSSHKNFLKQFTVSVVLVLYAVAAFAWGTDGHRIINQSFTIHYPVDYLWFARFTQYYTAHASDADQRKNDTKPYGPTSEYPRHFIDIDYYPEFRTSWFPHDLDSLIAKYGSATVYEKGVLPWAMKSDYDSLVAFIHNGDSTNANRAIADLGHYIGDACQPLHCTENYNRNGVHSRYESTMLRDHLSEISVSPDTARYIGSVLDFAFEVIYQSNSKIQEIFNADDQAESLAGNTYSSLYYQSMWSQLGSMTVSQLQNASVSLASLVYSAWIDAGLPPVVSRILESIPSAYHVSELCPNPFNPLTNIKISIPKTLSSSKAPISTYSVVGKLIRAEAVNLHPGSNLLPLSFASFPSGTYLVVVDFAESGRRERRTLKAAFLK